MRVPIGLLVNLLKLNLVPLKDFVFLGIHFQTVPFICHPSRDRWGRLWHQIRKFLKSPVSENIWAPPNIWAPLTKVGVIGFLLHILIYAHICFV